MVELRKTERLRGGSIAFEIGGPKLIQARLERLAEGNPRDVKPVGKDVSGLRIGHGPGFRVYFKARGRTVIILRPAATSAPSPGREKRIASCRRAKTVR